MGEDKLYKAMSSKTLPDPEALEQQYREGWMLLQIIRRESRGEWVSYFINTSYRSSNAN